MDSYEATKIVFSRIQSLDPQNASKIMGLLLIQDHGDKEMIRLAFGPQNVLHSLVLKARQQLLSATAAGPGGNGSSSTLNPYTPPFYKRRSCSVSDVNLAGGLFNMDDPANSGFGLKPCLYYAKGFCKNGPTCNFVHHPSANVIMGDELRKFNRARFDSGRVDLNPASRQIYLTFPADSTFSEEDVSNYFSIYGAVEDVRIPYQQKRMFGFVTFVHPDTVKMILAKGNPHFVCDARVLVKPYKEKPKLLDNFRKQQMERGEFLSCNSPTALDSKDPFDVQFVGKMGYESEYILWRRKLAEEQAELHHSLELQSRRLMGLQILDVKRNHHRSMSTGAPIPSPNSFFHQTLIGSDPSTPDENCASPPLNYATDKEKESSLGEDNYNNNLLDSLDLPDSPFASPTKGASKFMTTFASGSDMENSAYKTSSFGLNNITTTFDIPPFTSCYDQLSRYSTSSSHGAIGL